MVLGQTWLIDFGTKTLDCLFRVIVDFFNEALNSCSNFINRLVEGIVDDA